MIKRDFQNHNAFNLDKLATIGYNAPISRARLEVNIMLTTMNFGIFCFSFCLV